jgi:hypothetical protein
LTVLITRVWAALIGRVWPALIGRVLAVAIGIWGSLRSPTFLSCQSNSYLFSDKLGYIVLCDRHLLCDKLGDVRVKENRV